jgi:Tfp pilus assembly protein PilN
MIRVNLLKAQGVKVVQAGSDLDSFEELDDKQIQKQAGVKICFFILGPLLLGFYDSQLTTSLKREREINAQTLSALQVRVGAGKKAVDETTVIKAEQSKLQAQITSIENLTKGRLIEVKVLDLLQKQMPQRMYLSELSYKNSDAELVLKGVAKTDLEINTFMQALQSSAFIREVRFLGSTEEDLKTETVRKFELVIFLDRGKT